MSWLVDPSLRILEGALDGLSRRESLIASNLANIDTPGYQPQSIDFETALRSELASQVDAAAAQAMGLSAGLEAPSTGPSAAIALRTTDPRHFAGTGATLPTTGSRAFDGSVRNDGNAVDLESEMTSLVETQLRFGAVSRLVTGKLEMLRDAIGGR